MTQRKQPLALFSLFFVCGVLLTIGIGGCSRKVTHIEGSGQQERETRELDDFDAIKVEGIGTIIIEFGKPASCTVIAEDNLLEHYKTEVKDNVLTLAPTASIRPTKKLRVALSCESLNRIELGGATEVQFKGVRGGDLKVVANGTSKITAAGNVEHLELEADGTCEFEMFKLKAATIDAVLHGASKANLHVTGSLTADIHGASSICYDGNGSVNQTKEGVGSIRRRKRR